MILERSTLVCRAPRSKSPAILITFIPASMSYSVPADLQHHIDIITPTVHFDVVPGKQIPQRESAQRARAPSPGLNPGSGIKAKPIPAKKILAPSNQAVAQGMMESLWKDTSVVLTRSS
jgi:hypothetical protein